MRNFFKCSTLALFLIVYSYATYSHAAPADETAWISCTKDADCTSVKLGCWYWQPVNKSHAEDMRKKYVLGCLKSTNIGPQPTPRCDQGVCINSPYTVGYWIDLDMVGKNKVVDTRISACIKQGHAETEKPSGLSYVDFRQPFLDKANAMLNPGKFPKDTTIAKAMASIVPCKDVLSALHRTKH